MREIKFRAWDIEFERWARQEDISIQGNGECWIDRRASDYGDVIDTIDGGSKKGAIIEQYTGLKDKKGREIYEGDVLAFKNAHMMSRDLLGFIKYDPYRACYVVNASIAENCFGLPLFEECDNGICDAYNLEVIGTIHENPELLTT